MTESVILYICTASTDNNLLAIQLNSANLPAACQNHVRVIFIKPYLSLRGNINTSKNQSDRKGIGPKCQKPGAMPFVGSFEKIIQRISYYET